MAEEHEEAEAVTGRPNDTPIRESEPAPLGGNSTLASRRQAREGKRVAAAEDKAVQSSRRKAKK